MNTNNLARSIKNALYSDGKHFPGIKKQANQNLYKIWCRYHRLYPLGYSKSQFYCRFRNEIRKREHVEPLKAGELA